MHKFHLNFNPNYRSTTSHDQPSLVSPPESNRILVPNTSLDRSPTHILRSNYAACAQLESNVFFIEFESRYRSGRRAFMMQGQTRLKFSSIAHELVKILFIIFKLCSSSARKLLKILYLKVWSWYFVILGSVTFKLLLIYKFTKLDPTLVTYIWIIQCFFSMYFLTARYK